LITRKEGPAQNEIFSIQEGGPPLTDDMILGHKLYKKQSRLLGLYGGGEAELGSGSLVVFVIFLLYFCLLKVVVQNTYQSTLVGCKVREFESTRFGPESGWEIGR